MKVLDLTLPTPEENLACDEALLDRCEAGDAEEVLRFWESPEHFVVVGYANKVATEVNLAACEARGIPILRRCSGGGTVVQGPGCLNYALIMRFDEQGPLRSISTANQFIMERNRDALASSTSALKLQRLDSQVRGHTDLAVDGLKFSGNSHRRRRHWLLFHGTFLLNFDLALVSELLLMPSKQPDYRQARTHDEFITNLNLPAGKVKEALRVAWHAEDALAMVPRTEIRSLVAERYSRKDWNFKL